MFAMKPTAALLLLFFTACALGAPQLPRDLVQFGKMIVCTQPNVNPMIYNNYGCWCGFGGSGSPLDTLDNCCYIHDKCYESSRKQPGCSGISQLPYFLVYDYTCRDQEVSCSATNDKCQAAVCECDRAAAHCFAETSYNADNKDVDPVRCEN
ncbi:phospholipase A2 [Thalassophryne amazonica]|uniref:phospholipase A2 n=1 Tax=Thalassophryne amazonica TaxID=390379 RepID=UPI0014717544|nr:phospholipase A2 [Thalassophryne amazonica]